MLLVKTEDSQYCFNKRSVEVVGYWWHSPNLWHGVKDAKSPDCADIVVGKPMIVLFEDGSRIDAGTVEEITVLGGNMLRSNVRLPRREATEHGHSGSAPVSNEYDPNSGLFAPRLWTVTRDEYYALLQPTTETSVQVPTCVLCDRPIRADGNHADDADDLACWQENFDAGTD